MQRFLIGIKRKDPYFQKVVITARKRSLGQGNIFRSVCPSFCPQGGGGVCAMLGGACVGACMAGGPCVADWYVWWGRGVGGRGHAWQGACMVGGGGCGWQRACMVGGHTWQGARVARVACVQERWRLKQAVHIHSIPDISNNDLPKFTHLLGFSLHGLSLSNRMKRNCRGTMLSGVREVGL